MHRATARARRRTWLLVVSCPMAKVCLSLSLSRSLSLSLSLSLSRARSLSLSLSRALSLSLCLSRARSLSLSVQIRFCAFGSLGFISDSLIFFFATGRKVALHRLSVAPAFAYEEDVMLGDYVGGKQKTPKDEEKEKRKKKNNYAHIHVHMHIHMHMHIHIHTYRSFASLLLRHARSAQAAVLLGLFPALSAPPPPTANTADVDASR